MGSRGEEYAAEFVEGRGMRVIRRNYRCRMGEIDIIAVDADTVVFIEVKTRASGMYGSPAEAVTDAKKSKLLKTAYHYIMSNDTKGMGLRFDVAEVFFAEGCFSVNYIENAFGE